MHAAAAGVVGGGGEPTLGRGNFPGEGPVPSRGAPALQVPLWARGSRRGLRNSRRVSGRNEKSRWDGAGGGKAKAAGAAGPVQVSGL